MKFQSITGWLNERKKEEHVYGCVMLGTKIDDWEANHLGGISEDDVYIDDHDESYGLEEDTHITLLYGIHEDEIDPTVVVDAIEQKLKPLTLKISEIDFFETKDYDVIKYNVPLTKTLKKYRDLFLTSFDNTQTFDGYKPHMTIAYVKPGLGKKYKKKLNEPFLVKFTRGIYSYHNQNPKETNLIKKIVNLENNEKEK